MLTTNVGARVGVVGTARGRGWVQKFDGDARYVRGAVLATSAPDEKCSAACLPGEPCVYTCEQPQTFSAEVDFPAPGQDTIRGHSSFIPKLQAVVG